MVSHQLIFCKWGSTNTKPPFVPNDAFTLLNGKAVGEPDFAVMKNDDVTMAVQVISPGSEHQPATLQLLARLVSIWSRLPDCGDRT
jgi:hypothetical protein